MLNLIGKHQILFPKVNKFHRIRQLKQDKCQKNYFPSFCLSIFQKCCEELIIFDKLSYIIIFMKNQRIKYKKISQELREEIIDKIINKGQPLKTVADEVNINISTCKAIVRVFQEEGRIGKKKNRNKIIDVVETYSFYVFENGKLTELPSKILDDMRMSVEPEENPEKIMKEVCREKGERFLMKAEKNWKKAEEQSQELLKEKTGNLPFGFMNYPQYN